MARLTPPPLRFRFNRRNIFPVKKNRNASLAGADSMEIAAVATGPDTTLKMKRRVSKARMIRSGSRHSTKKQMVVGNGTDLSIAVVMDNSDSETVFGHLIGFLGYSTEAIFQTIFTSYMNVIIVNVLIPIIYSSGLTATIS